MWILQEYRFYLIIAVIALAGIIALFFFVQSKQSYTSFTTDLNARYAQVQSIGKESNSIRDILTSDGVNLLGTEGNTLFGLSLDGSPDDIKIIDTDALDTELPTTIWNGKYKLSFITTNSLTGDAIRIWTMTSSMSDTDKWWNLGNDGAIVYSFENESVAKKVMVDYLPEGSLSGKHIFIPFTSTTGSKTTNKTLFSYYTTGVLPSTLPTINQDDMCNNAAGCTCSVTSTTIANGTICDSSAPTSAFDPTNGNLVLAICPLEGCGMSDPSLHRSEGDTNNFTISFWAMNPVPNLTDDMVVTYEYRTEGVYPIDNSDVSGITLNQSYTVTIPAGTQLDQHQVVLNTFSLVNDAVAEPRETYKIVITNVEISPVDYAAGVTISGDGSGLEVVDYIVTSDGYLANGIDPISATLYNPFQGTYLDIGGGLFDTTIQFMYAPNTLAPDSTFIDLNGNVIVEFTLDLMDSSTFAPKFNNVSIVATDGSAINVDGSGWTTSPVPLSNTATVQMIIANDNPIGVYLKVTHENNTAFDITNLTGTTENSNDYLNVAPGLGLSFDANY